MISLDWTPVGACLVGSWPQQVAAWGREGIAAYLSELEARGVLPDAALTAIRSYDPTADFPPSAAMGAQRARRAAAGHRGRSEDTDQSSTRQVAGGAAMTDHLGQTERSVSEPTRIHWDQSQVSPDVLVTWRGGVQTKSAEYPRWERKYVAADVIEALLPKVYDGMHLTDCPYIDVLLRIKEALNG